MRPFMGGAVLPCAVSQPRGDGPTQDVVNGVDVKVPEQFERALKFSQLSEEVSMLTGLLHSRVDVLSTRPVL